MIQMITEELYASMSTQELLQLRWAFEQDKDEGIAAGNRRTVAFADSRLEMIARELEERDEAQ
jgi:hypothetical protein